MKKSIYSLALLCSIMSSVNAQQKENNNKQETVNAKLADFSINKSSTDVEIKRITEILEKQYEIQLNTSKIKRNDEFNNLMQQMINFIFVELWKNYADD
jgi:hypothetical protein